MEIFCIDHNAKNVRHYAARTYCWYAMSKLILIFTCNLHVCYVCMEALNPFLKFKNVQSEAGDTVVICTLIALFNILHNIVPSIQ